MDGGRGTEAELSKQPGREGWAQKCKFQETGKELVLLQDQGYLENLQSRCQLAPTVGKLRQQDGIFRRTSESKSPKC